MKYSNNPPKIQGRSLRPRGRSGLKLREVLDQLFVSGLRPRGRSGLKSWIPISELPGQRSPSSWAEWVEIHCYTLCSRCNGSPSSWAEWVEILCLYCARYRSLGLRPRGRSGLKYYDETFVVDMSESPSSRAEWIFLSGQSPPSQRSKLRSHQIQDYV